MRTCRSCGCTDQRACVLLGVGFQMLGDGTPFDTCCWAEPDLCSACLPDADPGWLHPGRHLTVVQDQPEGAAR